MGPSAEPATSSAVFLLWGGPLSGSVTGGDQDHLVPPVPQEELLKVTFLIQVHLETGDFPALMAQEDQWDSQGLQGHLAFLGNLERRDCLALQAEKDP
ncbi:hypothetical protein I79_025449 [Cricetulus griseus]|uniref:Uncharacterized protein n=1 Tax=Cricetulus griseus TaxID=10029 RepID=G3IND3_CRIGR|nr:hypothetical protein I79_025449 [Cricetulus griseus]